jgi:hypothetical protein
MSSLRRGSDYTINISLEKILYSIISYLPKPWALCSYGAAAHCPTVVCVETMMVYKLIDLQKYGWIHPPSQLPPFYIMIVQRISAISCGAAVGESPHSEEGS